MMSVNSISWRRFATGAWVVAVMLIAALFLVAWQPAMAQGWPDVNGPPAIVPEGVDQGASATPVAAQFDLKKALSEIYKTIAGVFKSVGVSASSGVNTILALYTLGIAIGGVKVAGGMDMVEAVVDWVKFSLLATFALAAVMPMPWLGSMAGGSGTLGEVVRGAFYALGDKAFGSEAGGGAIGAAGSFMQVVFQVLDVQIIPVSETTWMAKFAWLLTHPLAAAVAALMLFCTIMAMAVAGAIVVGEVFFAMLAMDLAIAMAPILVPWVLFRPLSFLFDAWLRTILVGGMTYVVASLVAKGAGAFATTMVGMSKNTFSSTGVPFDYMTVAAVFGSMFMTSIVFIFIAMRVSSLAGSLIKGSGVSGIGIGDFRTAAGGITKASSPMSSAGRSTARSVGGAAGRGASMLGGMAVARMPPRMQRMAEAARFVMTGRAGRSGGK